MKNKLLEFLNLDNIATELDDQQLVDIGQRVSEGYEEDKASIQDWLNDVKKVMELTTLKSKKKSTPLPDSANIKFPIITKAVYEYSSKSYPEIVADDKVVKTRVIGKDIEGLKKKQAQRVEDYMNYQLLFKNSCWEEELDKLLTLLPLIGFLCKRTYYDPIREEVKSEICDYDKLIINKKAKNLYEAERISQVIDMSLNDAIEYVRKDLYLEDPIKEIINQSSDKHLRPRVTVIEQHCFLDLDDDDYAEPYIVTVLAESNKVLRIVPRYTKDDIKVKNGKIQYIDCIQYFTDYHFLVDPNGNYQSVGFGILLLHMNATINTLLNQIVDAGQLANLQGGFIDARAKMIESGNSLHNPGELRKVKTANGLSLDQTVHMFQFKEPSSVLFQTLGLLIDASRDLVSATDVMTGNSDTMNAKTGAVMALQEEGRKVFVSIQKRVYRSLCEEYRKIFKLNQLYLDPNMYYEVLDDKLAVSNDDFDSKHINVIPVADPKLSSESTRLAKAQFLANTIGFPGVKPEKITRRIYESTNIENFDELLMSDQELQQAQQQPNPDVLKVQGELEGHAQELNIKGRQLELDEKRFMLEVIKTEHDLIKSKTEALLNIAKAESLEAGSQLKAYENELNIIQSHIQNIMQERELNQYDRQMDIDEQAMQQQAQAGGQVNADQGQGMAPAPDQSGIV